jgi:cytidylate kinase
MAIRVVTIEREFGAGASAVAETLAKKLGWRLLDRELTDEIARYAKVDAEEVRRCDERVDPLLYRLGKVFLRGSYERSYTHDDAGPFDADRMVKVVMRVVEEITATGNFVIVGRGAPWILRHRPDAFHAFLYAPRKDKIDRVVSMGQSREEAEDLVDNVDRERIAFVKRYFQKDWPTRYLYHVMINTTIGTDAVVETILQGIQKVEANPSAYTDEI